MKTIKEYTTNLMISFAKYTYFFLNPPEFVFPECYHGCSPRYWHICLLFSQLQLQFLFTGLQLLWVFWCKNYRQAHLR